MNNPAGISHPPPQRPQYPPSNVSYRSDYSQPNGRPSPVNIPSPQMNNFGSPSPQSQYNQSYNQPAAKRPRLSPEAQSPYNAPQYPQTPTGPSRSPVGGFPTNGLNFQQPRPGTMAPPQRPLDRDQIDGNQDNRRWGAGAVNLEQEQQNINRVDWSSPTQPNGMPSNPHRPGSSSNNDPFGAGDVSRLNGENPANTTLEDALSEEERKRRSEERANWNSARHSQNPLWDMFLFGGDLNDKMRKISQLEHLTDPQTGVLVNTHRTGPPPIARVSGHDGAERIVDKGQAILDLHKGDRLADLMKCITLAAKSRITGLMAASSRLALERRQHSKGKVPTEWEDLAIPLDPLSEVTLANGGSAASNANPLKRTHDQANDEETSERATSVGPNQQVSILARVMAEEKVAEDARRIKRLKRKAVADAEAEAAVKAAEEAAIAKSTDSEPTKKSKKAAQAENAQRTEAAKHQTVNTTAQMALAGTMKKSKKYSWMQSGPGSGASTPSRPGLVGGSSASSTPKPVERSKPVVKEKQFAAWDEDKDRGIQARDLLLVLESDGKSLRSYTEGTSKLGGD